ncbi:alpha/beta fold hydrolase [Mycetocola tolaasinivorans]|uniref:Alpha/beta fold hydrolase n=1 Tax=Mycetocola tolaasinivorans TaxID=76635 RepID=A0A3L7A9A6_9MICO|nr:alpha/beta fold hydrolase [Mycetocola tolaasinivorans]RLP76976.1 alpha/beta fold hydrolase [Mycetocola tolaasinivorans]
MNPSRRAERRAFLLPLTAVAATTAVVAAGIAAVSAIMAREVLTPPGPDAPDTPVLGINEVAGTIVLGRTDFTVLPGQYGIWYGRPERLIRIGEVLEVGEKTVTRELPVQDLRGVVGHGHGRFTGWVDAEPAAVVEQWENVAIPVEGGIAPAWLIPSADASADAPWLVVVHGRGTRRGEGLRAVPTAHAAGYHVLLLTYRNDGDAPFSTDRRYGLGQTEWADVDAALGWVRARSDARIVLMGWSMGGAIALQTVLNGEHHGDVHALLLDSPVINWHDVLSFQARERRLPRAVRDFAVHLIGANWARRITGLEAPVRLDDLNLVARAAELRIPTLILQSTDDDVVPANAAQALAAERPDTVDLEIFSVARHTKLWNFDRERWETRVRDWLDRQHP